MLELIYIRLRVFWLLRSSVENDELNERNTCQPTHSCAETAGTHPARAPRQSWTLYLRHGRGRGGSIPDLEQLNRPLSIHRRWQCKSSLRSDVFRVRIRARRRRRQKADMIHCRLNKRRDVTK